MPELGRIALLATGRVCLRYISLRIAVGSYPTLFTLTTSEEVAVYVSVALFLRLRAVAVSNYRILCCPDFPLAIFQASDYIRAKIYFNTKSPREQKLKLLPPLHAGPLPYWLRRPLLCFVHAEHA